VEPMPHTCVGFDMEWQPERVKGQSNPVELIQLASATVCLLFHMRRLGNRLPRELEAFLLDKKVIKVCSHRWDWAIVVKCNVDGFVLCQVGLGVINDLRKLRTQFGIVPKGMLDVAEMAKYFGFGNLGLKGLASDVLGWEISKKQAQSNWGQGVLSPAQRKYAATDAYVTLLIYQSLDDSEGGDYWLRGIDSITERAVANVPVQQAVPQQVQQPLFAATCGIAILSPKPQAQNGRRRNGRRTRSQNKSRNSSLL